MAKPRIFISSTYYDLRHIRKGLEIFVESLGYEGVLFESGDIPFSHEAPLDESCYKEIGSSHMLVLIIGGRFGSQTSDSNVKLSDEEIERHYQHYNSITQRELETALTEDIPVYIFVEKGVAAEYGTYKENKDNPTIRFAHVDSVNVFRLLEFIYSRKRNNLTREFDNLEDITQWLRDQWAGLFTEFLARRTKERPLQSLQIQLTSLKNVTETLKGYSESIIRGVAPDKAEQIIHDTDAKYHQQMVRDLFTQHHLISHLIDAHGADVDKIIHAFRDANTVEEILDGIASAMTEGERCGIAEHQFRDPDSIEELNALRSILDMPAIQPTTLKRPRRSRRKKTEQDADDQSAAAEDSEP